MQIIAIFLLKMNLHTVSLQLPKFEVKLSFFLSYSEGTKIVYFKRPTLPLAKMC